MNKIYIVLSLAVMMILSSCVDEERLPIVVLDTVEKGAYPRLIDQTDKLVNLFDVDGSSYTYNIEFVDETGGEQVVEYIVDVFYDDNNADNGDNSAGPFEFVKLDKNSFTPGANGYLQAPTITIKASEVVAALGLSQDDLKAGDNFNFVGRIILEDGRVFSQSNSSATVVGPAFRGHFNYTLPANCPSDLTGEYAYTTTNIWCPDGTDQSGTVAIEALGGGEYKFSDWAFGAYGPCYGGGVASGMAFQEVCAVVSFTAFTDSFGDTWTFDSSIDGENWIINWENTYGESASSTVVFPGGVPFTLAE